MSGMNNNSKLQPRTIDGGTVIFVAACAADDPGGGP